MANIQNIAVSTEAETIAPPPKKDTSHLIVTQWKDEFRLRIKSALKSQRGDFTYRNAVDKSIDNRTDFDEVMIKFLNFMSRKPLRNNDYYKYVQAYREGKELNEKYFKHDVKKLHSYYAKFDKDPEGYNPFNYASYQSYVLFMMLKLEGVYSAHHDDYFAVSIKDNREYSPISKTPSVLRGELPFAIKEYDIVRAYPTFIDNELGIKNRSKDVYEQIDKVTFNTLLNMHTNVPSADIEKVREQLKPIYNGRTSEVITEERFLNQGRMFRDLVVYEEKAIAAFVDANNIENYVRLHDGVFVKASDNDQGYQMQIEQIKFAVKHCAKPAVINDTQNFYNYDEEGKLTTSATEYAKFFKQENHIRVTEEGNDKVIIFQDTNNVVKPFNHRTETVGFLKANINELLGDEIENRIARDIKSTIEGGYLLLDSKPLKYYTDPKDSFGLSFKNGFHKYSASTNDIEVSHYSEVDGFFPPHQTQAHEFKLNEEPSEFAAFLTMACTGKDIRNEDLTEEDSITLSSFCTMFGYLCHGYKDQAFSPAIILSDEGANDLGRNGGRGKTILTKAVGYVQSTMLKGGSEFDPSYTHNFADLDKSKRVYIIDDVIAAFKYDNLYTNIVGDINCERKGTVAQSIPFKQAPKFVITTNWAVRYSAEDTSTNRRFIEYKFTDFFNLERTPRTVFGRTLFDDWDDEEWNRFYSFVFYCVGLYLDEGLQRIAYDKTDDNYRAYFSNDAVKEEFERLLKIVKEKEGGFTVSDFLNEYQQYDNPLRHEGFFSKNNVKILVDAHLKKHNSNFKYHKKYRKWIGESLNN